MDLLGYILYLISLYIRPQDWHPYFLGMSLDIYIYIYIIFASIITGKIYIKPTVYTVLFILWVAWIYIGGIVKSDTVTANTWSYTYFRYFVIYICTMSVVNTKEKFTFVIWTMILLTSILGIQNIYQVINGVGWAGQSLGWEDSVTKTAGEFGRARWVGLWDGMNVMCLLFVVMIPFTMEMFFKTKSSIKRIISALAGALIMVGAFLTKSRGGLLALLVILCFYFNDRFKGMKGKVIIGMVVFAFILAAPARMGNYNDKEKSASYRVDMWEKGFEMVRYNAIVGVGRGNFKFHSHRLIAHNSFIEMMGETGLVGLFLWSSLLYAIVKGLIIVKQETKDPDIVLLSRALLFTFAGYILTSVFITTEFELLYLLIAIGCSLINLSKVRIKYSTVDFRNIIAIITTTMIAFLAVTKIYWKIF